MRKSIRRIKFTLSSNVPNNKLLPWQPGIPEWWHTNQDGLLQQILSGHKVASDDFDEYVMCTSGIPTGLA